MAAPAFGFSVGDFVNTVQLLAQIINALRASSAAPDECRQAVIFLETVQHTLHKVQDLQLVGGDTEAFQRIHACTQACCDQVIRTLQRARQYDAVLARAPESGGSGGPRIRFRRNKAKVKWSLALKDDLAQLMAVIMPQISTVQLILQVADTKIMEYILALTQRNQLQLDRVETNLEFDARAEVEGEKDSAPPAAPVYSVPRKRLASGQSHLEIEERTVQVNTGMLIDGAKRLLVLLAFCIWQTLSRFMLEVAKLPQAPTMLLDSNIVLTDALGRTLSLPYEHFSNWSMTFRRLNVAFKDCPGEARVAMSRFLIYDTRNKFQVLNGLNWERSVSPGTKVLMVLIVGGQAFPIGHCPRCGCVNRTTDYRPWQTCRDSDLQHQLTSRASVSPRKPLLQITYGEQPPRRALIGYVLEAEYQQTFQEQREFQACKFVHWTIKPCFCCHAYQSTQTGRSPVECRKCQIDSEIVAAFSPTPRHPPRRHGGARLTQPKPPSPGPFLPALSPSGFRVTMAEMAAGVRR